MTDGASVLLVVVVKGVVVVEGVVVVKFGFGLTPL